MEVDSTAPKIKMEVDPPASQSQPQASDGGRRRRRKRKAWDTADDDKGKGHDMRPMYGNLCLTTCVALVIPAAVVLQSLPALTAEQAVRTLLQVSRTY